MKATEVTVGLAESNGSLLPGIWRDSLHVTCGLTACTPGSAPGPTLGNEYGKTLHFYLSEDFMHGSQRSVERAVVSERHLYTCAVYYRLGITCKLTTHCARLDVCHHVLCDIFITRSEVVVDLRYILLLWRLYT